MDSKRTLGIVCLAFLLVSCGKTTEEVTEQPSGAKSAVYALQLLADAPLLSKASAPLGLFLSIAFDQIPSSVLGSKNSVVTQMKLFTGQAGNDPDEAFELLQQLGEILQVDVPTILNQSSDRIETLNRYTESLESVTLQSVQVFDELQALLEELADTKKTQRIVVRDFKRALDDAVDEKQFQEAGLIQQDLSKAEQELYVTEAKEEQTDGLSDSFEDMLEVADERLIAIDQNREILISGLQVVDLPGIDDLGIIKEKNRGEDVPSFLRVE